MRRLIVAVAGAAVAVAGLTVAPARASTQTDAVETRLLQLINQGRGGAGKAAEVMHSGLRLAAQQHSADMSARNTMDHTGYPARVNNANPDPAESNGPPDDGFTGASCENVAWYQPGGTMTTDQIAQQFYTMWFNSAHHHDCMFDVWGYGLNVGGVGIYYANGKWWATFDSAADRTPPSGTTPPPPSSTWKRVQQTATSVRYGGTWSSYATSSASGGSFGWSRITGSSATFSFTGTGVKWIGIVATSGGIASLTLDGQSAGTVDQYASSTGWQRTMFQRTGLASGTHTLKVSVSGMRNVRATDQRTFVDAFDYYS